MAFWRNKMPSGRNTKLTQTEAEERFLSSGYKLLSEYISYTSKVTLFCEKHSKQFDVVAQSIFRGSHLPCCTSEMRSNNGKRMVGEKNPFYGHHHTQETIERNRLLISASSPFKGKKRGPEFAEKIRQARTGTHRTEETKSKLRAHGIAANNDFDACVKKARTSKTHGKRGHFYIADIGNGKLKFGSTTMVAYRIKKLKVQHGFANLLLAVLVDDAADYEASMMEAHRDKWLHGEVFSSDGFLAKQAAKHAKK
jgi:hypothetical protein